MDAILDLSADQREIPLLEALCKAPENLGIINELAYLYAHKRDVSKAKYFESLFKEIVNFRVSGQK